MSGRYPLRAFGTESSMLKLQFYWVAAKGNPFVRDFVFVFGTEESMKGLIQTVLAGCVVC